MAGGGISGVVGAVRWGYYTAAVIEGYTVMGRGPKGALRWSLTARMVQADAFKLSQRPLVFVALHAQGSWRWPIVTWTRVGDELRAELGPVEEHVTLRPT
jgi:hypothetical protein